MRICITSDLHYGFPGSIEPIRRMFDEIAKEKIDIILIAGDIISTDQNSWHPVFKDIRKRFPNIPVMVVLGNHDLWQTGDKTSSDIVRSQIVKIMHDYDIRYLHDDPFISDNCNIYGVDGWYWHDFPPTNDIFWMDWKEGMHGELFFRSLNKLNSIPQKNDRFTIIVTHFEPNESSLGGSIEWLPIFQNKCDLLITGHTHRYRDSSYESIHIINAGSDYCCPLYRIIESGQKG